jgi:hypothetical protein
MEEEILNLKDAVDLLEVKLEIAEDALDRIDELAKYDNLSRLNVLLILDEAYRGLKNAN